MTYNDNLPFAAAKESLTEWRGKITAAQKEQMQDIELRTGVPVAALVRMALDVFLPKMQNNRFTEDGITNVYKNKKY